MLRALRTLRSSRSSSSLFMSRFTVAGVPVLSFSQQMLNQRAFLQIHPTGFVSASIINFPTFTQLISHRRSFATSNEESPKTISEKASTKKVSRIRQMWEGSRMKVYWNKYGMTFAGIYTGIYVSTVAGLYALLSNEVIGASDAKVMLEWAHLGDWVDLSVLDSPMGYFMVAWVLAKFTEPFRFAITALMTPRVARMIRARRNA